LRCSLQATRWAAHAGQGWEGGQWPDMLWGLVIGLQLALASYVFGEQCALIIDRYLVAGGAAETAPEPMLAKCGPVHERKRGCAAACTPVTCQASHVAISMKGRVTWVHAVTPMTARQC